MSQLQHSSNRKKTLTTYLQKIQQANHNIQNIKNQLSQQITDETNKYNECQASKLQ